MYRIRKPVAVLLAAFMLFAMCSCSGGEDNGSNGLKNKYFSSWIDSSLFDNVGKMANATLKDDYAAAVNYSWAKDQKEDYSYAISGVGEGIRRIVKNIRTMLDDESNQNKNIELLRIADGLYNDWDYRNKLGVEPLKKYLAYIDDIKTIDDVSAYMLDNDKNPFATSLVKLTYEDNEALDDCRAMCLNRPDLILGEESYYVNIGEDGLKKKDAQEARIRYLLGRCGYSEKEINKVISGCFRFETTLIHLNFSQLPDYKTVHTREEVLKLAGDYPFADLLDHYSIKSCNNFMGFISYLDNLETIYKQDNVEDMKSYFKARLALDSILYLDKDAYDFSVDKGVDRTNPFAKRIDRDPELLFFAVITKTTLSAALDQAYIDYYYNEDIYKESKEFIRLLKEKYLILIDANKDLSETSKKAIREKLNKMGENLYVPNNKADFTGVDIKSKEQGGSFLDAFCPLNRVRIEHLADMVENKHPKNFWDIYDSDTSTVLPNACYVMRQNTVYIYMGILEEFEYSTDAPLEKKLGSLVAVLGHEISHAFDDTGICFDADGKRTDIVSKKELKLWEKTKSTISDHFTDYEPFEGAGVYETGSQLAGEVIADTEGLKAAMMIGKDHSDFNYDLFFRTYAYSWRSLTNKASQMSSLKSDDHPLDFLRINYTLIQFDEFYETYGIKPGDGMYKDPANRILIW